ncbi:RNA polymerase sigma factor, sigma-70 family [Paenibacillus sp. RU4T]|uniref:sigma-70 family RNA polymerase sigma factor n=1 Tax=unclassified Paenibacillus TaxID=185978 RepID=UPI000954CD84|nr:MULTISPECIES: sigma-70 family RNA polymerase sigma factor [unclassified Paenibacillus]SIR50488.1 RNA polymerase sigma factor, sigma-70 family [Paenibacillus sp. RU4X]SIR59557.1 RNA polymerase sigma factor, sigma-70 family [Paenibacillus sp. RU4T]
MSPLTAFSDKSKGEEQESSPASLLSPDFIVQRFFSKAENLLLLSTFLDSQSLENWTKLEEAFRKFYFEVRFTKYLSSTIKYAYFDFERKRRRREDRSIIVFDMEMYEENSRTFGEGFAVQHIQDYDPTKFDPQMLQDAIGNESIYKAFSELTSNQKMILTFTYSLCYLDKDIADRLSISPQAVSKARKSALANLKKRLIGFNWNSRRKEAN